jgi:ATP synthase protein I
VRGTRFCAAGGWPMDQGDDDGLGDLEKRLDKARRAARHPSAGAPGQRDAGGGPNPLALGLRIGLELVVAVFVGAGLGWAFDDWLGTRPWGLVVFLFLGFGAGVTSVFRVALRAERAVGYGAPPKPEAKPVDWSEDED